MEINGKSNQAVSGINVTPLIDVLLVLLIIFMVIVPATPHGLDALVPQPPRSAPQTAPPPSIIVQVSGTAAHPQYRINEDSVSQAMLESKLAQIFATRQEKQMFISGDSSLEYAQIAAVIDMGHRVGVDQIGLVTGPMLSRR